MAFSKQEPFEQFARTVGSFDQNRNFGDFDDMDGFGDISLKESGMTPGDLGENLMQWLKNSSFLTMRGQSGNKVEADIQAEKEVELEEKLEAKKDETAKVVQEQQDSAARFTASQKEIADRVHQEQVDQARFDEQKRLDAQKYAENKQATDNVISGTLGFLGFGMFTMFAPSAVTAAGQALSPSLKSSSDPMLVTSNNDGGLLGTMRNTFGMTPTAQDGLVMGNNNVLAFTAGQPVPGTTPTMTPTSPTLTQTNQFAPTATGGVKV